MPLQDLTPELRTRLHRVERTVGWFVALAVVIILAGFAYYVYATAAARGWFVTKINYATGLDSAAGLALNDPVKLMGFDVGEITGITPNSPFREHGVTIFFHIRDPYWGYIWYDSRVRVNSDFLGKRFLEVVKGQTGEPSAFTNSAGQLQVMKTLVVHNAYKKLLGQLTNDPANQSVPMETIMAQATNQLMDLVKSHRGEYYTNALRGGFNRAVNANILNYYYIQALEEPALSDRLAAVAISVQQALPSILGMTNQLAAVLSNADSAVSQLNSAVAEARPTLTNLSFITANLRDPNGSLGNWLLPTNLNLALNQTLQSARETLDTTDTNLTKVATDLDDTLQHLSDLTSNLAWQVHVNTNLLGEISTTIVHADDLVQGLKREWFLRGAFKKKHSQPATEPQSK